MLIAQHRKASGAGLAARSITSCSQQRRLSDAAWTYSGTYPFGTASQVIGPVTLASTAFMSVAGSGAGELPGLELAGRRLIASSLGYPAYRTHSFWLSPIWLRGLDLNQRPMGYEPIELPGCSTPQVTFNSIRSLTQTGAAGSRPYIICWRHTIQPSLDRLTNKER